MYPTSEPATLSCLWRRFWVLGIILATLAYYFWTGMIVNGELPPIHGEESDHFNLLSRGFRQGHLYLDKVVPEGLLNAPNPYDPALRGTVKLLHDASYYRGKYYIYFGPAPVVTVFLPFSVLTGRDLPLSYAVWFFSAAGYLALAGTFLFLQRRHFPTASLGAVTACLIALGGANMVVTLLRRSNIWEVSGASGFGFFAASLYCLIRAVHSRRATAWAAAGGLILGLAVASRPTYIVGSALFVIPLLSQLRKGAAETSYTWRAVLAAALGCGLPVLLLLVYNYARFGSPLEFGLRYQLTSVIESESRHFSLTYVPFNFHVYFLSTLRWLPYFPFVNSILVPPFPPGHGGYEYTIGLFPNLPFAVFSLVLPFALLLRRPRTIPLGALGPCLVIVATAAALNAGFLLVFFGCCIRYMVDFAPWFMLLAGFGLLATEARLPGGRWRKSLALVGCALALFSSFTSAMTVVDFYGYTAGVHPPGYRPLARALNRPVAWLDQRRWPNYQPVEIALSFPADRASRQEMLTTVARGPETTAALFVDYLGGEKIRFGYRETSDVRNTVFSPAVAAPGDSPHTLRLSIGGSYAEFDGLKGRLRAQFDGMNIWDVPAVSFGAYPGKLTVGADVSVTPPTSRFSGVIHSVRPIDLPALPRPRIGGIRVRLTLDPSLVGRSLPLVTSGRTKAGDLFFLRVHRDQKISFGYDHWGDSLITSPEVAVRLGEKHSVEFWLPALPPPGMPPALVVRLDGVTVWECAPPAYPVTPETVFLGVNSIGGSTCEPKLEHSVFEELQLPAPVRSEK